MTVAFAAIFLSGCATGIAVPALAADMTAPGYVGFQAICGPKNVIFDILKNQYDESPTGAGLSNGSLYQLWENRRTDTWSFIMRTPDGSVCVLATGEDWDEWTAREKPKGTAL